MKTMIFWNLMANNYSKSSIADEASYQEKLKITRTYLNPDMNVMEFGCGTGSTAITHAPLVKHILATDGSKKMIEIAEGKAKDKNIQNVRFECINIDEFTVTDQTFDVVMGHSILHLLENKENTIAKVYKMLKPGGVFITSTICMADDMKFAKYIAPVGIIFGLTLRIFTTEELKKSFTEAGFKIDYEWKPEGETKATFIVARK